MRKRQTCLAASSKVFLAVLPCRLASTYRRFEATTRYFETSRTTRPSSRTPIRSMCSVSAVHSVVSTFSALHALQVQRAPPQPLNTLIPNFRCVTRFFSHCDKDFSSHSLPICVNYAGTRVSQCPSQYYCFAPTVPTVATHSPQVPPPLS